MKSWKQLAAILINKFIVGAVDDSVRIAFGEQVFKDEESEYHVCMVMNKNNARELANLINRTLDEHEAKTKGMH